MMENMVAMAMEVVGVAGADEVAGVPEQQCVAGEHGEVGPPSPSPLAKPFLYPILWATASATEYALLADE